MLYMTIDLGLGEVACASAGHPQPRLLGADGTVTSLDAKGLVLGIAPGTAYDELRRPLRPAPRSCCTRTASWRRAGPGECTATSVSTACSPRTTASSGRAARGRAATRADVLRAWASSAIPVGRCACTPPPRRSATCTAAGSPPMWTPSRRCQGSAPTPRGRSSRSGTGAAVRWSTPTSGASSRGRSTVRGTPGPRAWPPISPTSTRSCPPPTAGPR